jgi:hypothetical protein
MPHQLGWFERGVRLQFCRRQDRRELFAAEVVQSDLMAGAAELVRRRFGDGVVETAGVRMSEDDRDVHYPVEYIQQAVIQEGDFRSNQH